MAVKIKILAAMRVPGLTVLALTPVIIAGRGAGSGFVGCCGPGGHDGHDGLP